MTDIEWAQLSKLTPFASPVRHARRQHLNANSSARSRSPATCAGLPVKLVLKLKDTACSANSALNCLGPLVFLRYLLPGATCRGDIDASFAAGAGQPPWSIMLA